MFNTQYLNTEADSQKSQIFNKRWEVLFCDKYTFAFYFKINFILTVNIYYYIFYMKYNIWENRNWDLYNNEKYYHYCYDYCKYYYYLRKFLTNLSFVLNNFKLIFIKFLKFKLAFFFFIYLIFLVVEFREEYELLSLLKINDGIISINKLPIQLIIN
jgi:hypothetical protein